MSMDPLLQNYSEQISSRTALVHVDGAGKTREISFLDLDSDVNRAANTLISRGIRKGDHFLICCADSYLIRCWFLGGLKIGAVPCIVFPGSGAGGLERRARGADSKLLIRNTDDFAASSDRFTPAEMNEDDPGFIVFTSGTSGAPKPVLHRRGIANAVIRSMKEVLHASPEDRFWCTAHPAWITGTVYGILGPALCGITAVLFDGAFHAGRWMPILADQRVTLWYTAPSALRGLMRAEDAFFKDFDFSNLKQIYSVGEPLSSDVFAWGIRVFGKPILDTWFQTETGTIRIANAPGKPLIPGTMGKAVDDTELEVRNIQNGIGELWLRAGWESAFTGYYRREEETAAKFRDGWFRTGDAVRQEPDGTLTFIGRIDNVINTSGHLVGSFEIEQALMSVPEIADVYVIAEPDPLTWQKPAAHIQLHAGVVWERPLEMKLRKAVTEAIAPYAVPAHFYIEEEIRKTDSGKTIRK